MADINPLDPNAAQLMDLSQQRKLAELLTQQGLQAPQGQMVSGQYVKSSPLQYLSNLANLYVGQKTGEQANQKALEYAKALQQQKAEATQNILGAAMGQELPAQAGPMPNGGNIPIQRTPADLAKAIRLASGDVTGAGATFMPSLIKQAMPEATTLEKEFAAAKLQGYQGNINDFKNQMSEYQKSQAADAKQRLGLEGAKFNLENQKFGLEKEKFALEQGGGKLTEAQGNATAFGMRMKESNQLINDLEKKGVTNTGVVRSTLGGIVGMTPFVGEKLQQGVQSGMNVLPGALGGPSAEQQQVDAARKNFITAVLRKESGAAISPTEFYTEAQKYFPQPGDSDSVIKQKKNARETAIKAMEIQAGPGKRQIEQMGAPKKVVNFNDLP